MKRKREAVNVSMRKKLEIAKIRDQYSLYKRNVINLDLGTKYVFAEKCGYNDKIYLDHVGSIAEAKQLRWETTFFSISGSVGYTRVLNRKTFINVSLGTRGSNDSFLTDVRGIKYDFASTTLSVMAGGDMLRKGGFFIIGSAGLLLSFVYIDPVSDRNVKAGAELQAQGIDFDRWSCEARQLLTDNRKNLYFWWRFSYWF